MRQSFAFYLLRVQHTGWVIAGVVVEKIEVMHLTDELLYSEKSTDKLLLNICLARLQSKNKIGLEEDIRVFHKVAEIGNLVYSLLYNSGTLNDTYTSILNGDNSKKIMLFTCQIRKICLSRKHPRSQT